MPSRIFVDTLFVIALINPRDHFHQQALELSRRFARHPFLVTDAILLEIGNGLARSYRREAIEIIEQFLVSPDTQVVHVSSTLLEQAIAMYKLYDDKTWGLVDCISFVVMHEADVREALTFDQHFVQAGFQILMS